MNKLYQINIIHTEQGVNMGDHGQDVFAEQQAQHVGLERAAIDADFGEREMDRLFVKFDVRLGLGTLQQRREGHDRDLARDGQVAVQGGERLHPLARDQQLLPHRGLRRARPGG